MSSSLESSQFRTISQAKNVSMMAFIRVAIWRNLDEEWCLKCDFHKKFRILYLNIL